jgi:hypothetical protein
VNHRLGEVTECEGAIEDARRRRSDLVLKLEKQRSAIGSLKTGGFKGKVVRMGTIFTPEIDERSLYTALVSDYERELATAGPLLAQLKEELRKLEDTRNGLLKQTSEDEEEEKERPEGEVVIAGATGPEVR